MSGIRKIMEAGINPEIASPGNWALQDPMAMRVGLKERAELQKYLEEEAKKKRKTILSGSAIPG